MAHIIVATDFAEQTESVVHYACDMAVAQNLEVIVLHTYVVPVTIADTPLPMMSAEEAHTIATDRMKEFLTVLKVQYSTLHITGKIMYGDVVDCLIELTEKQEPWLIVLGNNSIDNSLAWMGTTTVSALKQLPHTVMALPVGLKYTPVQNICLACDIQHYDESLPTQELIDLVKTTGAVLHVLNVSHNQEHFDDESILAGSIIQDKLKELNPTYHFVENENIDEGVRLFAESNQMDWLLVIPQKHTFFESLWHKSHTKAMSRTTHIPLVALHSHLKQG